MKELKKLPESELEIMQAVWKNTPPITTHMVMESLNPLKEYKQQTVLTLLNRLHDRGFIRCEKEGRSRLYHPLVSREEYLQFETGRFMEQMHQNSLSSLVAALYRGKNISQEDINDLQRWLEQKE
ncbi:BlaI/MecI/CopY family transcriptional regulator [Candidatus Soleaferrea massiliensis]|uniref:BlaI/MecI/CopY family transcriptional regulator n=1 Tax=Candidatus Soleaferrea massiliensis TaxID=1470354 RepID=UPI00058FAEAC|nr:BlaI/MecI/CopY family transcriptional regulator [Candidatus Soleaferrea massiliensis]